MDYLQDSVKVSAKYSFTRSRMKCLTKMFFNAYVWSSLFLEQNVFQIPKIRMLTHTKSNPIWAVLMQVSYDYHNMTLTKIFNDTHTHTADEVDLHLTMTRIYEPRATPWSLLILLLSCLEIEIKKVAPIFVIFERKESKKSKQTETKKGKAIRKSRSCKI